MGPGNDTRFSNFLLLGLSDEPELQPLIFGLFLSMYLITVFGNLLLILAVSSDSHLHTPHVLLPLQPVLCRHLFHLHYYPKDAGEYTHKEQCYNLRRLHHPDVLFHTLWRLGQLSSGCDGL